MTLLATPRFRLDEALVRLLYRASGWRWSAGRRRFWGQRRHRRLSRERSCHVCRPRGHHLLALRFCPGAAHPRPSLSPWRLADGEPIKSLFSA
jgi:hypothetical protein